MRVTTKGQVTIPIEIREHLGIQPNTEVKFVLQRGYAILEKVKGPGRMKKASRGEALVARMRQVARHTTRSTMTTDELMALTRGE
jgi:AbrB family looped-hinge helix DNA binding protein